MIRKINYRGVNFSRFYIEHESSPSKITTDSILLGAWAPIKKNDMHVLDLGTGCGIIAMMLAQRFSDANYPLETIDAVEIDEKASWQAIKNINHSPYNNIDVTTKDFTVYANNPPYLFDLIVSNPPYCTDLNNVNGKCSPSIFRYNFGIGQRQLLESVQKALKPDGRFCVVLTHTNALRLKKYALMNGWHVGKHTGVRYSANENVLFSLLELSLSPIQNEVSIFSIRDKNKKYSEKFVELTKDFYQFL